MDFQFKNPQKWSPDSPVLYELSVDLLDNQKKLDSNTISFGVRSVTVVGSQVLLNEIPIWIKGMNYVYQHSISGLTLTKQIIDSDLDAMSEAGINTIRVHFPPSTYFMNECDRRGILIYCEIPVYCMHMEGFETADNCYVAPEYLGLAKQMMKEMIESHYNHPSVIIWGIGNECDTWQESAKSFFQSLLKTVKDKDSSRPICYASLWKADDFLYDMVDIIGINEYIGWYDRIEKQVVNETLIGESEKETGAKNLFVPPIDLKEIEVRLNEFSSKHKKPLIFTEFGADAIPKYISEDRRLWSEDYQAEYLSVTYGIILQNPRVAGAFPFCFNDYQDPSKPVNDYWDGINYKGIVSSNRTPKLAYEVIQDIYNSIT